MTAALSSGHSPHGLPMRLPDAEDPLALSLNENPFAPLPSVRAAMVRAVDSVNRYPEFLPERFRRLIAGHLGLEEEQIIVGAGATGVVMQVLQSVTRPGDRMRVRFTRLAVVNRLLAPYGLKAHDDGVTPGLQLFAPNGERVLVPDLDALWREAARLARSAIDPLSDRAIGGD